MNRIQTAMDGNSAAAEAVKQVNPDVVVVHPITPATPMLEKIAAFVANGQIDTEILNSESAYSAISGCIGASAAGGRVFTAAASQGLASMHEILFICASLRLPIVAGIANRALSAPENIYTDHSDAMAESNCGWIQIFSENPQEVYDNLIQAFKIAEHPEVLNPIMVCMDGFITSHSIENITIEETAEINSFTGKYRASISLLDSDNPVTIGSYTTTDYYFEQKINQRKGIDSSKRIIKEIGREFGDRFGRYYGFFESYKMEDAESAILLMGSANGTAKEAIDNLRQNGEKVGLLKLRVFRPFPSQELRDILTGLSAVAVLDRTFTPGTMSSPLFSEVRTALYESEQKPLVFSYVYGLGGRDIGVKDIENIFMDINEKLAKDEIFFETNYIGLRK